MNKKLFTPLAVVFLLGGIVCRGQSSSASLLITEEPKRGQTTPELTAQDLRVTVAGKPATVNDFTPAANSPIQLLLLIDDSASFSLGTEINTLKNFVQSLPPSTQVAIGYMRNGMTDYTQQFTSDHAAAAKSIRLAFGRGGADVSPYDSLSYSIKHWTPAPDVERREVIMISSGIEALGGGIAPDNPYVNKSIADAQRAGVVVFGIYSPSVGHFGHTLWRTTLAQSLLSQLCEETGGESYIETFGPPVDFAPYLSAIERAFGNQYRLAFTTPPVKKAELVSVKVKIAEKDADVAAPTAVLVRP